MEPKVETAVVVKPKEVVVGVLLLSGSLVIGGIRSVADLMAKVSGPTIFIGLLVLLLVLGFFFFFVYMASKGRNWARIVIAIFFALGIVVGTGAYIQEFRANAVRGSISFLIALMQFLGTIMLFLPNSNAWFRKQK